MVREAGRLKFTLLFLVLIVVEVTDLVFALAWGSFPVLTGYFAQHSALNLAAFIAALYGALVAGTQRQLSTPARNLRRHVSHVEGAQVGIDGSSVVITKEGQLQPLENALRTLCWASDSAVASRNRLLRATGQKSLFVTLEHVPRVARALLLLLLTAIAGLCTDNSATEPTCDPASNRRPNEYIRFGGVR